MEPSFTFETKSAFAGSPVSFQLSLRLQARKLVPNVVFSCARLSFNEQIPAIVINHTRDNSKVIQKFGPNVTTGNADLSLQPNQVKVLEFSYTPVAEAEIAVFSQDSETNRRH